MFKFNKNKSLSAVPVVAILMLCGVVVSIVTYKVGLNASYEATDGTYTAYETLTGQEISRPNKPGTIPDNAGGTGGGSGSSGPILNNIIPEGGTYTAADGTVYNAGDKFPEEPTTGDIYVYEDYEYRYNQVVNYNNEWSTSTSLNGWGVDVLRELKTSYGDILNEINNYPIKSLQYTFSGCTRMLVAPAIPKGVISMKSTFSRCEDLEDISAVEIPAGVTDMTQTFSYCESLIDASKLVISENVTTMYYAFVGCSSLEKAPNTTKATKLVNMACLFAHCISLSDVSNFTIPASAKDTMYLFENCYALSDLTGLVISEGVTTLNRAFYNCTSLVDVSELVIPDSMLVLQQAFQGCTSLINAPKIPRNVTHVTGMFIGCTSLTGEIEINHDVRYYSQCFQGTEKPIKITGSCSDSMKASLVATATNGNVTY